MNETYEERVIRMCNEHKDIIMGDDGYYVYWPDRQIGALTERDLLIIAKELRRLNEPWNEQINEDLGAIYDIPF